MAPSEEFIFLPVQAYTLPRFQLKSRSFSEPSERQGGSVWWNRCAHVYKVCSQPFQIHGTWFFVFYSESMCTRIKLSFHSSQKVLLALIKFLSVLKNGLKHVFGTFDSAFPENGKNLSKSVIICQVPKKTFDNVGQCYNCQRRVVRLIHGFKWRNNFCFSTLKKQYS